MSTMNPTEIVTVRPEQTTMTKQQLPNFVGISGASTGAQYLSMNLVIIPPGGAAQPHVHRGYETAIYFHSRVGCRAESTCWNGGHTRRYPVGVLSPRRGSPEEASADFQGSPLELNRTLATKTREIPRYSRLISQPIMIVCWLVTPQ